MFFVPILSQRMDMGAFGQLGKGVLRPRHERLPARVQEDDPGLAPCCRVQLGPEVVEEQNRLDPEVRRDEASRHQDQGDDQPPFLPAAERETRGTALARENHSLDRKSVCRERV